MPVRYVEKNPHKVLVVAPRTDLLLVDDEVMQVVNTLGAKLLQGSQADVHGLLSILSQPFDIVWFATHGDEEGIHLTDGNLSISEITQMVRSTGARLVVLNTCSSRPVALTIHDELKIDLICTIRNVPDRTAFITGTIFARKVAEGFGFKEAYELAKPGQNSMYSFLSKGFIEMPPRDSNQRINEELESIITLVRRLEIIVSGNPDYNVEGLVPTVRLLNAKIEELMKDFYIMRANQLFNRRLLVAVTVISISSLIAMLVLVYQRGIV